MFLIIYFGSVLIDSNEGIKRENLLNKPVYNNNRNFILQSLEEEESEEEMQEDKTYVF